MKSALSYIFASKAIIFGLALFNFVLIWTEAGRGPVGITSPWYDDWSYICEPNLLLMAAAFLLLNRWWSYLTACILSSIVFIKAAYLITITGGWIERLKYLTEHWKFMQENNLIKEILLQWEIQSVLAIIIFSVTIYYAYKTFYQSNIYKTTANES